MRKSWIAEQLEMEEGNDTGWFGRHLNGAVFIMFWAVPAFCGYLGAHNEYYLLDVNAREFLVTTLIVYLVMNAITLGGKGALRQKSRSLWWIALMIPLGWIPYICLANKSCSKRESEQIAEDKERRFIMSKKIVAGVVIIILALVVCLAPIKERLYTVAVDYQDTEPLSYEVIEAKSYTGYKQGAWHEGYNVQIPGGALPWGYRVPGYWEVQLVAGYGVTLKNTDEVSGTFTVQLRFKESPELRAQSIYLKPGEEGLAGFRDTAGQFTYEVIPETKTITKQRQEARYKKVSLLDYLLFY